MRVLIIEDDDYKYNDIINSFNSIDKNIVISRCKSCNSGLNKLYDDSSFIDLIITDNYMPTYDDEINIRPYAEYIINETKKINDNIPVVVCSSMEYFYKNSDYNIVYGVDDLEDKLSYIIKNLNNKMKKIV